MAFPWPRRSVVGKMLPPLVVAAAVGALAGTLLQEQFLEGQLARQAGSRAKLLVDAVNYAAEAVDRPGELQRMVSALGGEPGVELILVASGSPPRVIASNRNILVGRHPHEIADPQLARAIEQGSGDQVDLREEAERGSQLQFTSSRWLAQTDVSGRLIPAVLVVRLDLRSTQRQLANAAWWLSAVYLALGSLLLLSTVWLLRRHVLSPLKDTLAAVLRRAEGDKSAFAPVHDHDELGALSSSYNDMIRGLADAEERFRQLAETIEEVFWIRDATGGAFLYVSPTYERRWGGSATDLYRDSSLWFQHIQEEDRRRVQELLHSAITTGWNTEYRIRTPQERTASIHERAFPIKDSGGRTYRMVGVSQDVTEAHAAALALREAKDAAEAASRAKGEFVATVSHELRTPLNGILGFSALLLSSDLTPQQREHAKLIEASGQTLLAIVNDILDLSKIESGALELDHHPTDIVGIATEVQKLFEARAAEKKLSLGLKSDLPPETRVLGDANRLRQVLTNLVGNALKFTDEGGVEVALRLVQCNGNEAPQAPPHVHVSIEDTGIGIPKDKHPLLFRRFSQVDGSTKRRHGGTGLGLAICKNLIDLMGGSIGVESRAGRGSRFWFRLPSTIDVTEHPIAAPPRPAAPRTPKEGPETALRVLVAEDNPVNQVLARALLERLGHSVDVVADGREAIERTANTVYDIILMDCQMPGVDGYEATRAIRSRERPSDGLPIVALTANAMGGERERCLASGMDDFLTKPIRPVELARVLERLVASRTQH